MIFIREAKVQKVQEVQMFKRFRGLFRLCETYSCALICYRIRQLNRKFPINYRLLFISDTDDEGLPDCSGTGAGQGPWAVQVQRKAGTKVGGCYYSRQPQILNIHFFTQVLATVNYCSCSLPYLRTQIFKTNNILLHEQYY